jgi:AraC-like DNA-binding protein
VTAQRGSIGAVIVQVFGDVSVEARRGPRAFALGGECLEIVMLAAGELELRERSYREGTLFILPASLREHVIASAGAEMIHYRVTGALLERLRPFVPRRPQAIHGAVFAGVLSRLDDELRHVDPATPLVLEAAMCEVVARARRAQAVDPDVSVEIAAALRYASEHVAGPITLSDLAAAAHLSARNLSARFATELHTSPLQWVRDLRIRTAARSLRETSLPLGDVALRCGFYDHAHLTRSFRRALGMTPTEYRRTVTAP